jgi:hypothetical protein
MMLDYAKMGKRSRNFGFFGADDLGAGGIVQRVSVPRYNVD